MLVWVATNTLVALVDQLCKTIRRKKRGIYENYEFSRVPIKYTMPVEGKQTPNQFNFNQ